MYAVRWDEEKIIQGLAVAMCLAMVGLAIIPMAIGSAWAGLGYLMTYVWKAHVPPAGYWAMAGVSAYTSVVYPYILYMALEAAGYGSIAGPAGIVAGFAITL